MSSHERNAGTDCRGWHNRYCTHHQANPVGSSQIKIDQGQHEPENSDAMEMENQRNASKAKKIVIHLHLQDKKGTVSVDVQNQQNTWKAKGTEKSDARVAELNQRLQEEKAKVSKKEEAIRRQKQEARGLEAQMAGLRERLRKETESSRRTEKGLEAKVAQLSQQRRAETEASRRKEKGLEAKVAELTAASRRRERDMEQLKGQNAEMKRLSHEKTVKLSKLEEDARQNSAKEKESRRLIAELKVRLQEKTVKPSNSRRKSTKGECSERLEEKVAKLETKIAGMEDDARQQEQRNHDLSAKNQEQSNEINQLKDRVKTLIEQAIKPPSKVLVRKPDSISMVEAAELVRMLNAQIEQLSSRIAYPFSYREPPSSGAVSAGLNDLRGYLGPRLFDALHRRSHEHNSLLPQIALQTVLVQVCRQIVNHWNPPFWDDDSISFRVYSSMERAGPIVAGTWSALPCAMSQSEVQEAVVQYLNEILAKAIVAVGGPGEVLPPEYEDDVEDIAKRALDFRQIISKDMKSMDLVTFTIPSDARFNPSQMIDTEGSTDETERVICTLEMGLQYRKKAELGKSGGGQCGVTLKPKVVLPVALET